jgi:hypothetical protein
MSANEIRGNSVPLCWLLSWTGPLSGLLYQHQCVNFYMRETLPELKIQLAFLSVKCTACIFTANISNFYLQVNLLGEPDPLLLPSMALGYLGKREGRENCSKMLRNPLAVNLILA